MFSATSATLFSKMGFNTLAGGLERTLFSAITFKVWAYRRAMSPLFSCKPVTLPARFLLKTAPNKSCLLRFESRSFAFAVRFSKEMQRKAILGKCGGARLFNTAYTAN
jgi:hypothetical protein